MILPKSNDLDIESFSNIIDLNYLQNSYKIYWLYGIFDIIKNEKLKDENYEITFEKLVYRMLAKSWYTLLEFRLHFGWMDQLQDATYFIHKKYKIDKTIAEKELIEKLEKISEDKEIKKIVEKLSKYVAYRLLSPFYTKQIRGCKDSLKNSLILKLSNDDERAFYKIDKKKIILNPKWIKYFHENQVILEGWILYKLIFFLQKRNVGVPEIPFKISMPKNRNLNIARKFWKEIIDNKKENLENIYDDSVIEIENFSIDHFIPWSFVLHDEIWNLVPTSKKINSSKNDNLPDLDSYLEKFCETQYVAYNYCNSKNKKKLEHYMTLVKGNPGIILEKEEFISKLRSEIIPLHQIAYNQGFPVWKYNQ